MENRIPQGLFRFLHIRLRGVQPGIHGAPLRHAEDQLGVPAAFGDGTVRFFDGFQCLRLFRGHVQARLFQFRLRLGQPGAVFKFFQLHQGSPFQDDFSGTEQGMHLVHLAGNAGGEHCEVGGLHHAARRDFKGIVLQLQGKKGALRRFPAAVRGFRSFRLRHDGRPYQKDSDPQADAYGPPCSHFLGGFAHEQHCGREADAFTWDIPFP